MIFETVQTAHINSALRVPHKTLSTANMLPTSSTLSEPKKDLPKRQFLKEEDPLEKCMASKKMNLSENMSLSEK
jgi:hypothetical protein